MSRLMLVERIHMALDALEFDAGDWDQENRARHLLEQIKIAKRHLSAIQQEDLDAFYEQQKQEQSHV